jgi:hypothetical protein
VSTSERGLRAARPAATQRPPSGDDVSSAGGRAKRMAQKLRARPNPGRPPLDVEAGVFEVEVTLDTIHDVVVDAAFAAEVDDCLPFGVQHLAS